MRKQEKKLSMRCIISLYFKEVADPLHAKVSTTVSVKIEISLMGGILGHFE